MRNYFTELPWPELKNVDKLITRIDEFPEYLTNQNGIENYSQAANLFDWPTRQEDLQNIIEELPIDNSLIEKMTVQRILPPGIPMHVDRNRPVAAMAIIKGRARTVFREKGQPIQFVDFEPYKWYIFDGHIPHLVREVTELRVALCINLSEVFKNYAEAKKELCS